MLKDWRAFQIDKTFTTPGGHSYHRCSEGRYEGRWAIADSSGANPWTTDDGVLWVQEDQSIDFGAQHIALQLQGPDGATQTLLTPAEALIVASRLGLALVQNGQPMALLPTNVSAAGDEELLDLLRLVSHELTIRHDAAFVAALRTYLAEEWKYESDDFAQGRDHVTEVHVYPDQWDNGWFFTRYVTLALSNGTEITDELPDSFEDHVSELSSDYAPLGSVGRACVDLLAGTIKVTNG